ncbi:MAG: DUF3888 domain-containing protein [Robinsoniella sp.]|nr:DUF3888 domain-containing protein [Robinsoniella sp.]
MKKYRLIFVCLLIVLAFLLFNLCNRNRKPIIETFNVDSTTKEDITDELIIALFIEDIAKEAANFYSEYYVGEIAVYNYEITIVDIGKKEPGLIYVKFGVTPQIGAHDPLGYDELVYKVDSRGNKELAGYEHLKSYEVPEKFQKNIKKSFE